MDRRNLLKAGLASLGAIVVTPEIKAESRVELRKVSSSECLEKGGARPFKSIWFGKQTDWIRGVECLFCGSQYPVTDRHGPCFNCGVYW